MAEPVRDDLSSETSKPRSKLKVGRNTVVSICAYVYVCVCVCSQVYQYVGMAVSMCVCVCV